MGTEILNILLARRKQIGAAIAAFRNGRGRCGVVTPMIAWIYPYPRCIRCMPPSNIIFPFNQLSFSSIVYYAQQNILSKMAQLAYIGLGNMGRVHSLSPSLLYNTHVLTRYVFVM
jgi:hypothetical protein